MEDGMQEVRFAVLDSLAAVPVFGTYFGIGVAMTLVYVLIYTWVTPHPELRLIRENVTAAAIAFVGSLLGFVIALASAIAYSVGFLDCVVWGVIALIAQIVAYLVVRMFMPMVSERIAMGETASGLWLGGVSLAVGILNAASITY